MKLSIHLVTWNGSGYIPYLFDSLKKQTFKDFELVILDNASSDDTVEKIKIELGDFPFEHELMVNKENRGFAGGHTQLLNQESRHTGGQAGIPPRQRAGGNQEYILLLNQDIYLMTDCLEKLVRFMDGRSEAAAVSPRLMKWDFANTPPVIPPLLKGEGGDFFTDKIDTLGLKVLRSRRVVEWKTGEKWPLCHCEEAGSRRSNPADERDCHAPLCGARNDSVEVFGVSGALSMFRKSAIDAIGLFDESFGSYKEDVDLAFRLRSAGFKSYVVLDAVAYHDRSASGLLDLSDKTAAANKKQQSELVRYNSYKNHLMTLIKNEYWQNFLLDSPFIKWYEFKKFWYFLLFDRKVLKGWGEIWQMRKEERGKRKEIIKKRKIGWRDMRIWWK